MTTPSPQAVAEIVERLRDTKPLHSVKNGKADTDAIAAYVQEAYAIRHEAAALVIALQGELEASEKQNAALRVKLDALAPHGTCACSYDAPDETCMHHSPALVAAEAEVVRLREGAKYANEAIETLRDRLAERRSGFEAIGDEAKAKLFSDHIGLIYTATEPLRDLIIARAATGKPT